MSLLISMMSGCVSMRTGGSETTFFVENGESIFHSCAGVDHREAAIACHRLANGRHLVVGIRQYSDAGVDREVFRKITFVIDHEVADGEVVELPSDRVRVAYGSGLSFMPGKSGCYGQATSGSVSVSRRGMEKLEIHANLRFDLKSPLGWADACEMLEFRSTIVATRSTFEDMGPWEGVRNADDSIISESAPIRGKRKP